AKPRRSGGFTTKDTKNTKLRFVFFTNFVFFVVSSEPVLQPELQNARRCSRLKCRNPAEVCEVQIQIRIAQIDVVQQVERLESQLEVLDLGQVNVPGQRHIDGTAWRPPDVIDRQGRPTA